MPRFRPRLLSVAAVLTAAASSGVLLAAPAQAAVAGHYTGDGIRIRSCPSTSCTAYGVGYPSHSATIYCYKTGTVINGSPYWYYHRDNTTGVVGYSADAYMSFNGSVSRC